MFRLRIQIESGSVDPDPDPVGKKWSTQTVWRIRDVYPGSRILIFTHPGSRISDPGSKNSNKREGWKKICCYNFLCSHKFHKIAHYFSFDVLKKKIWANFQRIIELFTQKIVNNFSKIWIWDPGSGIRDPGSGIRKKPIPDPGSRGQKGTDPGSRIRNTAHKNRKRSEISCFEILDILFWGLKAFPVALTS